MKHQKNDPVPVLRFDLVQRQTVILQEMADLDRMHGGELSNRLFFLKRSGRDILSSPYPSIRTLNEHPNLRLIDLPAPSVNNIEEACERFEQLVEEYEAATARVFLDLGIAQ